MVPMDMSMPMNKAGAASAEGTHKAKGTVKKLDEKKGVVTLDHGPVNTLKWPPMVMGFKVKDKALMKSLATGKTVEVEFVQEGNDYVITAVKEALAGVCARGLGHRLPGARPSKASM